MKGLAARAEIVVLDLRLPDRDGADILGLIRLLSIQTTVIVLTGEREPSRLRKVHSLLRDAIFFKPLEFADFEKWWQASLLACASRCSESVWRTTSMDPV